MWCRTSVSICLVALTGAACSGGSSHDTTATSQPSTTTTAPGYRLDDTVRLDQVQVLGSHNSYHGRPYPQVLAAFRNGGNAGLAETLDYAHAPLPRQFALGVRQIELDVWSDPLGGKYARPSLPITLDNEGFRAGYLLGHPSLRGRLIFTPSSPGQDDAAFAKLNDPIADAAKIKAALAAHMIVRTRADADTLAARADDTHMERAALSGGAQLVSTDYEQPDPTIGNGYTVRIPGGTPGRCDPVTGPPGCKPTDVEDPKLLAVEPG